MTAKKEKLKVICYQCNNEFLLDEYILKDKRKHLCSKKCVAESQRKIFVGQRVGRWTVVKYSHIQKFSKYRRTMWEAICDCGTAKLISSQALRSGHSRSCGCLQREGVSKPFGESYLHTYFSNYKWSSEKRGKKFPLTKEQFKEIVLKDCHYCGEPPRERSLARKSVNGRIAVNGIDRLDNNIDYDLENCVPCCEKCNFMKMKLGSMDFLFHIEKISSFQKNKCKEFPISYLTVIA